MKIFRQFFFILLSFILFTQEFFPQDIKNMTLLGNYGRGEGESKAVFAAGSLVFYGLGSKMQVASFSNPASPVKVGSLNLSDVIEDLVRTSIGGNQYIVACGGSKMWIVNVQNPTLPTLTAPVEVAPGTTCEGIATSGTYAYVAAGGGGFKIYDISVPATPSLVTSIDSLEYCESVVISGQYAYVAAGDRSHIVDISNPASPVYVGRIDYSGYHQYLNVRSGYAYICNYDAGLAVVNVANPASPVFITDIPSGYRTARIIFDGNFAYVAVGDSGMAIYNVVNPASPVFVTKIMTTGRAASLYYGAVSVGGSPIGHIFIANRNPAPGISAVNVSNPAEPVTSSFLAAVPAPSGSAFDPFYNDGKVYVAYGTSGLRIIDVSTPAAVSLLGTANLGGDSREVVVVGNYAYVAARDSGLYVVDVTNPANPVKVKTLKTPRARGVTLNLPYVYLAASDSGLGVIDISDPVNPNIVKYTGSDVYAENIEVKGNIAGITDYGQITFYDMTDPLNPLMKGSTGNLTTGNEGFAIDGNFAYVPDGGELKIYDINDLDAPVLVSSIPTGGYGYTAAVYDDYCYVASEGTGVRAINISNPAAPVEDGYFDDVPQSRGLTAYEGFVYVAEKVDGLSIYANDLVTAVENNITNIPESMQLHQNYPNPFNPTTNIRIDLKERSHVVLEVFNSLGEKVSVLLNKQLDAGSSLVKFRRFITFNRDLFIPPPGKWYGSFEENDITEIDF
jgi:hypothetical protein